ncbi:MAG: monovalent cation/H(+) antiporter subunit G [Armatimonadetes bacterium]|nr:monovalent cation/H(+) antiporter subunit G [Armatimonadota bacterium]
MTEWVTALLLLLGGAFILLAGIGILRMPDVYTRMQPATKAATLGVGCLLLAVAVHFDDLGIRTRALAAIAFVLLTAPVAAHMIGRAAYIVGVPLWEGTIVDELRGQYDVRAGVLRSRATRGSGTPAAGGE